MGDEVDSVVTLVSSLNGKLQGRFSVSGNNNSDSSTGGSFTTSDKNYVLRSVDMLVLPVDEKTEADEFPALEVKVYQRKGNVLMATSGEYVHPSDWKSTERGRPYNFEVLTFNFPFDVLLEPNTEYYVLLDPVEGCGNYGLAMTQTFPTSNEGNVMNQRQFLRYINPNGTPPYATEVRVAKYYFQFAVNAILMEKPEAVSPQ